MNTEKSHSNQKNYFIFLLTAAVFAWLLYSFFYGEKVANHGEGWDGLLYAHIATYFYAYIHSNQLNPYWATRIFPSFVVNTFSHLFSYSIISPGHVVTAFYLYNVFVLALGIIGFYLIVNLRCWSKSVVLIGFSGLFLNYDILKMMPYYTVLTDYTAFVLGIWMLYFYLKDNVWGLIVTSMMGAFTFPSMLFCGALLLLFSRNSVDQINTNQDITLKVKQPLHPFFFACGLAVLIVCLSVYFIGTLNPAQFTEKFHAEAFWLTIGSTWNFAWIGVSSVVCLFLYVVFSARPLLKKEFTFSVGYLRMLVTFLLICVVLFIHHAIENPALIPADSSLQFLQYIVTSAISNPCVFLVSHFAYYGPVILLCVLYWNDIVEQAYRTGFGMVLFLFLYVLIMMGADSRQYMNAVPMLCYLVCEVLNQKKTSVYFSYFFVLLSVVISRLWLPINHFPWAYGLGEGVIMREIPYLIEFAVMMIVLLMLFLWKKEQSKAIQECES